jgi:subtilisin-like proprotein convertase family protein
MKSPFDRFLPAAPKGRSRKGSRKAAELQAEPLEKRAMMAIFTGGNGYLVVASNEASDVFMQRRAGGELWIADNSSFINDPTNPRDFYSSGTPGAMLVTNGDNLGGGAAPDRSNDTTSTRTVFSLAKGNIVRPSLAFDTFNQPVIDPATGKQQILNPINGRISLNGTTWGFSVATDGTLIDFKIDPTSDNIDPAITPEGGSLDGGSTPVGQLSGRGQRGTLLVNWSATVPTVPSAGTTPVLDSMTYTYQDIFGDFVRSNPFTESSIIPGATTAVTFAIPTGPSPQPGDIYRGIIPGTLTGTLTFVEDVPSGSTVPGPRVRSLSFADNFSGGLQFTTTGTNEADSDWVRVRITGAGSFEFYNAFPTGNAAAGTQPVTPGRVQYSASFMRYLQNEEANSFTLFAGHDLSSSVAVDLLTTGSNVNLDSPIIGASGVTLRATNININSPVRSTGSLTIGPSRAGLLRSGGADLPGPVFTMVETVKIDASVAAPSSADIDIANDPTNDAVGPQRGSLVVSPSGSISATLAASASDVTSPTGTVRIDAIVADVFVAGTIFGTSQSYLMQSDASSRGLAPFFLSTRSPLSGVDTGLIRGGVVSVTLANNAATPIDGAIAFNTLDLSTRVDSMRIRASTEQLVGGVAPNPSTSGPFPYNLSIREYDDITFDAVASSGLPISLSALGNIGMPSALTTFSDVSITALRPTDRQVAADATFDFTVSAPITTTKGRINIQADSVFVNNSVAVTSAAIDDTRNDITLTANSGNILLSGLVAAVNGVSLTQRSSQNSRGTPVAPYLDPNFTGVAIPDATQAAGGVQQAAVATVNVEDDFEFSDLDVVLDITHRFNSDLAATLVAPNGQRYRLFEARAASGSNFSNTKFDSDSPLTLASGAAPYTDRRGYQTVDSLAPLYKTSTRGEWRLEVVDSFPTDSGRLNKFQLIFSKTGNQVSGSAFITADRLAVEAEGAVGNPVKQPTASDFYLNTNVDEMVVRAGTSVAVSEQDDVNIKSLRAGDLVSLKAGGVDPVSGPNAGQAALQAYVIDVPSFDVSTPNGSMSIELDTAKQTILGNAFALQRGSAVNSLAAGSVTIRSQAGDIVALDAPVAGGNARQARVATSADLTGSAFTKGKPNETPDRLTVPGTVMNSLRPLNAEGTPLALRVNDRILVKDQASPEQNGVYAVTAIGTIGQPWTLTRAQDSDTIGEIKSGTYVRVTEGVLADTVWQVTYGIRREGEVVAGIDKLTGLGKTSDLSEHMLVVGEGIAPGTTIKSIDDGDSITLSAEATADVVAASLRFVVATPEIGTSVMLVEEQELLTDIGSDDINDMVTFVVSTAGSTNSSAGAFGKMVDVYQRNSAKTAGGLKDQKSELRFSTLVANNRSPIRLTQELPEIIKPVVIDGGVASRYLPKGVSVPVNSVASNPVIDGSRITTLRSGRAVTAADTVNGFTIQDVDGVTIRNVTIGGFNINNKGAAILVDDSANVLIDKVVLGQNEGGVLTPNATGTRLANAIGVHVVGEASDTTTIINSTILSSTDAGIKVEPRTKKVDGVDVPDNASYVRVAGNTIGKPGLENNVGVHFASGTNALGLDSAPQIQAMARRVNNTTFTLPAGTLEAARRLVPGMGVLGRRVAQTNPNTPVTITSVTINERTKITTVRVTGGRVMSNGSVVIGYVVNTVRNESVISLGLPLDNDEGRRRLLGLFLGQQVNGTGIAFGTTITKISEGGLRWNEDGSPVLDQNGNQVIDPATITLSQPMTMTGVTAISLSPIGRNVIQANRTGVILAAGSTTMTNTSVIDSNFNGIEISGGSHKIGTSKVRSLTSNAIHGNGGWGIAYVRDFVDRIKRLPQVIRGNYLGANQSTIVSTVLANGAGNIGPNAETKYTPNARTGLDTEGNQHGIQPVIATRGRSRFPWRA